MSVPSNLIPTRITQLNDAPSASADSLLLISYQGVSYKIRAGDLLSTIGVPNSRQVIAGSGLSGGGALSSDVTLAVGDKAITSAMLSDSGAVAGTYGSSTNIPVFTVGSDGRITGISNVLANITAANLAGGSNGAVPYQQSVGVTAFVAGTAGQVLVSQGTSPPTFQGISGGTF